jgi:hypothetical protein
LYGKRLGAAPPPTVIVLVYSLSFSLDSEITPVESAMILRVCVPEESGPME